MTRPSPLAVTRAIAEGRPMSQRHGPPAATDTADLRTWRVHRESGEFGFKCRTTVNSSRGRERKRFFIPNIFPSKYIAEKSRFDRIPCTQSHDRTARRQDHEYRGDVRSSRIDLIASGNPTARPPHLPFRSPKGAREKRASLSRKNKIPVDKLEVDEIGRFRFCNRFSFHQATRSGASERGTTDRSCSGGIARSAGDIASIKVGQILANLATAISLNCAAELVASANFPSVVSPGKNPASISPECRLILPT